MVAPLAGARSELEMVAIGSAWLLVAPLAGARIEMAINFSTPGTKKSLPSRERGLKLKCIKIACVSHLSLPSRERGLKYPNED